MDHAQADDTAEEDVAAKDTGGRDSDQNRQISERGVGHHVEEAVPVRRCEDGDRLAQSLDQTHHQAGRDDGRQDGNEDVAQ